MSTSGKGTYLINSTWASGALVFYERAVGQTVTGDVFTLSTSAVKVGGTSQDVDFQWYGTGSISAILDAGDSSLTLVGVNLATNAPVVITDATESTSTSTGALIVSGGIANAKDTYLGDDVFLTSAAKIDWAAGNVTLTHATGKLTNSGALTNTGAVNVDDATESTSTITGSLQTDGGLACAKDFYAGDDIFLTSGAVLNFDAGDVTITHAANTLAFAGATAAGVNGYSFDMAAGAIASEAHGIDVTATGTLASSKSLVGLNVAATAAGTAGAWLSGIFAKAVQASKMVNGYLCAAEFELNSTAADASDNSVVVLNSLRNHTGSPPACDPYITLREYGTTYGNVFLRVFGDTGQGAITGGADTTLLCTGTADKAANCAVRCMFGSTVFWMLGTTTAPS